MSATAEEIAETEDILTMFAAIRRSYAALSERDKEKVNAADERAKDNFGFDGFDGNQDPHIHVARDLLVTQGRFPEVRDFADRDSHTGASIVLYRRMLREYQRVRHDEESKLGANLTAQQIIDTLWARQISSGSRPTS